MRQLLGVLRHGATDGAPAPGLAGIEPVADSARAAGHDVTVHRSGSLEAVPAAVALCAYRVVQEAVTNAVRHAPGAAITVALRADTDAMTVDVTDTGAAPGGVAVETSPDRPRYGLIGLAERVAAAGGTIDAGPRASDPGWRVVARLPIGETST